MEQHIARSHQLREVEVARADERKAARSRLEARASNIFQQGADLRRFAGKKVDELRSELAAASQIEAGFHAAFASGNQCLRDQVGHLRSMAGFVEQVYGHLRSEINQRREARAAPRGELVTAEANAAQLAQGAPQETYEGTYAQKGLPCDAPWKVCQDELRSSSLREEVSDLKAEMLIYEHDGPNRRPVV